LKEIGPKKKKKHRQEISGAALYWKQDNVQ
jgi:hypothetical protein